MLKPIDILLPSRLGIRQPKNWKAVLPGTYQQAHLREAGEQAGLGREIGWHTFRHLYRSWLDDTGAPMKAQQELMQHASVRHPACVHTISTPSQELAIIFRLGL